MYGSSTVATVRKAEKRNHVLARSMRKLAMVLALTRFEYHSLYKPSKLVYVQVTNEHPIAEHLSKVGIVCSKYKQRTVSPQTKKPNNTMAASH